VTDLIKSANQGQENTAATKVPCNRPEYTPGRNILGVKAA